MRWQRAVIANSSSIHEAIAVLNLAGTKLVMVLNERGELQGTVTDGDIRRGLLRGVELNQSILNITNMEALVVPPAMSRETVIRIMVANKIEQLPIVDEQRRVVGLHLWSELVADVARDNLMVVMAGGLGTRLRPQTEQCPKPLLSVAGKPILQHIIERASNQGFSRFVLAINYLGHMIEDYFGDGNRFGVQIDYLREESPLGTAGALTLMHTTSRSPFLVTNGDVLTDVRYGELLDFHVRHSAMATMAVRVHEWQHPFGVVQIDGIQIAGFEEKPIYKSHINAGIYVLEPEALKFLKSNAYNDMPQLFTSLKEANCRTVAYPMHEPWLDVGRPDDLIRANDENQII